MSGVRQLQALSELALGESGLLVALDLPPGVQNHLMYMGFVPDARVRVLHRAPAGDPTVYSIDGIEIALRKETARSILVSKSSVMRTDPPHPAPHFAPIEEPQPDGEIEAGELFEVAR